MKLLINRMIQVMEYADMESKPDYIAVGDDQGRLTDIFVYTQKINLYEEENMAETLIWLYDNTYFDPDDLIVSFCEGSIKFCYE